MSIEIVNALDAEIEALTKELREHPAWAKREAAMKLRALYTNEPQPRAFTPNKPSQPSTKLSKRERSVIKTRILAAVDHYFGGNDGPFKAGDIYNAITNAGLNIPGKDPRNNLSAMLSNSDDFVSTPDGWVRSGSKLDPEVAGAADVGASAAPKSGGETPGNHAQSRAFVFTEGG